MLDFLKAVLPAAGPFCVAFRTPDKKGFIHKAATDHLGIANLASWGAVRSFDCYFCISSLKELQWVDAGGKAHIRKKENCDRTRVLVLDVDIEAGSDKKYRSKDSALEALEKFRLELDFPAPMIVDSGYGLHVYWLLKESIKAEMWERIASYFKAVAVHLDSKLAADTSRISDSAGVLRLPGTSNYKNREQPQEVKLLQYTELAITSKELTDKLYAKGKGLGITPHPKKKPKEKDGVPSLALDLGLDVPHRIEPVLKKCNWAKEYIINQKTEPEPHWYAWLGLLKHLYHPKKSLKELAIATSKGHAGFSEEATINKFNQVRQAQTGPTTCQKFTGLAPQRCEGCPFKGKITTPAQLDQIDIPDTKPLNLEIEYKEINGVNGHAKIDVLPIPSPYFRGQEGGIYMHMAGGALDLEDLDPKTIKRIYEYDIYPVARLQNEDNNEEEIEVYLDLPRDGKRLIRVPNEVTIEPKKFAGYLTARGVLLKQHEILPLINYMIDYTRIIQKHSEAKGIFTRFGWRNPQGASPSFVLGDGVINSKGEFWPANTAAWLTDLKAFASAEGDISKWREAFEVSLKHSIPAYQFAMMLGFAAPLFALTPYHGMMFNILGSGGIGKSTALKFMTSIWGKPTFTHILQKDNSIPVFNKIGYLNSIPVAYDEITNLPADQTADLAYSITEGRGKERADRSGNTRVNFVKWSTALVSCSNLSLYEKIGLAKRGNTAPAYRIFETELIGDHVIDVKNQPLIEDAVRVLEKNHGVAGRYYMQYVVKETQKISALIVEEEQRLTSAFKLRSVERFWGGMFATVSVGMDICRALGIHNFRKDQLLEWAFNQLTATRQNLKESQGNALHILSHFINSNLYATLFVSDGRINAYGLSNTPTRELHIRLEKTLKQFTEGYISSMAFKKYCVDSKVEYSWVTHELRQMGIVKDNITKRLGAGTEFSGTPVGCISLNFESPWLQEDFGLDDMIKVLETKK